MAEQQHRPKDAGIQSLRGIAIILMVAGHVIGGTADVGLTVSDDSGWRMFYRALEDLRMPLFTVLSGYVYAYRPVLAPAGLGRLLNGKVWRLLVPFVVVTTGFFLMQAVTPGVNVRPDLADLPRAYLYGYQHLWFLQAIFLIFLLVGTLNAYHLLDTFAQWAPIAVATGLLYILVEFSADLNVFSLNGFLRLLPFFLLGYGAHRFPKRVLHFRVLVTGIGIFIPVYSLRLWMISENITTEGISGRILSFTIAVPVVIALLAVRRYLESRFLIWIGGFSFAIYLLQVFGGAGSRIVASAAGITNTATLFVIGWILALAVPIMFELTFGRIAFFSWAVLGQKPRETARPESLSAEGPETPRTGSVGATSPDYPAAPDGRPALDLTQSQIHRLIDLTAMEPAPRGEAADPEVSRRYRPLP